MKKYFAIAAMAALALVSCNKNGFETDDKNDGNKDTVSGIVLNELDANNKFIEIYNTTDKEVSLEGVHIVKYDSTKEGGKSTTWTGAAGMKLAAHAWIYIESSDLSDEAEGGDPNYEYQSENHIFVGGLSGKKNVKIELYDAKENLLDAFVRGEEGTGWNQGSGYENDKKHSFSRCPDGTGEWAYADSTPGAANGEKVADIKQDNL
ncbi:MAG: lamin tail domain-containing protein [Candidatus Cryptobacteroides sp.]